MAEKGLSNGRPTAHVLCWSPLAIRGPSLQYIGRPGISPALAALIALRKVRRRDRILDVGCGTGTDVLTLARWGFRHVQGVDPDTKAVGTARARATRTGLSRRVAFHHVSGERLTEVFPPRHFDVVLHTLVANNLTRDKDRHFREVAAVMKPGGLLVLHERVAPHVENTAPGRLRPLAALKRSFDLSPGVATQLAEHRTRRPGPAYARVVLWMGRPRV